MFAGITGQNGFESTVLGGAGVNLDLLVSTPTPPPWCGATTASTAPSFFDVDNSTVFGGAGNDTLNFAGGATTARIKGEAKTH